LQNTFTNDVVGFLTGRSIPQDIIDLPNEFLSTPFGQSMRPMIENMYRGTNAAAAPSASQAASLLQNAAVQHPSSPYGNGTTSLSSSLTICTNQASFDSLLASKECLVIMFTKDNCPPCRTIKPVFEDLAIQYSHEGKPATSGMARETSKNIGFALVDTTQAYALASKFQITATPTFLFFLRGKHVCTLYLQYWKCA